MCHKASEFPSGNSPPSLVWGFPLWLKHTLLVFLWTGRSQAKDSCTNEEEILAWSFWSRPSAGKFSNKMQHRHQLLRISYQGKKPASQNIKTTMRSQVQFTCGTKVAEYFSISHSFLIRFEFKSTLFFWKYWRKRSYFEFCHVRVPVFLLKQGTVGCVV